YGLSLEQKFRTGTYLGLSAEVLNSKVRRTDGAFDVLTDELDFAVPSGLQERLDYQEHSLLGTFNQLLGKEWSFGARYRVSEAVLNENFVDVPNGLPPMAFGNFQPRQRLEGVLHQLSFFGIFNHPSGFFGEGE